MRNNPHSKAELETATARLDRARHVLEERAKAGREDLVAVKTEMADAALDAALTGDTEPLDALLERRRIAERDIEAYAAFCTVREGERISRAEFYDRHIAVQGAIVSGKKNQSDGQNLFQLPVVLVAGNQ